MLCEDPNEARDNGYYFYKYLCENHPDIKAYYAISKNSPDYLKVENLGGKIVEYGSLKHWIIYLCCKYNISSQKGGKPNAALCAFLELNGIVDVYNVFLQHGVIINNLKWLHSDVSKIDLFITSTIPETNYVKNNFGYDDKVINCTGMPRFDGLHSLKSSNNSILIMPTWRYWFNLNSKKEKELNSTFQGSEYHLAWQELLTSTRLAEIVENNNIEVLFYLHRNLQRFSSCFYTNNNHIKILQAEDCDIQNLLKESLMLITDYSSVFFDMVYMKKPVLFYQFDEEHYRRVQYQPGYFNYHSNLFGKCSTSIEQLLDSVDEIIKNNFNVNDGYLEEHLRIFPFYDANNCERIYKLLNSK